MRFLIDAQLPRKLVQQLTSAGHDALHTFNLPDQNRTADETINKISADESRAVVTKDAGFVDTFLLGRRPSKLLLVSTGNISNQELLPLFAFNLAAIDEAFKQHSFVELDRDRLIVHQ
jgi:predicted nuclease of predicted toxin-antitoxin system